MKIMTLAVVCALLAGNVRGALVLRDFEGKDGNRDIPRSATAYISYGVTNAFATSGENALHCRFTPWKDCYEGYSRYPGFSLGIPREHMDWRGYDRIAFDISTTAAGGDLTSFMIRSTNDVESKKFRYDWRGHGAGLKRVVLPLDKWSDSVRPDCVDHVLFMFRMPQATDIYIDTFTLLKPGEELPPPTGRGLTADLLPFLSGTKAALESRLEESERKNRHDSSMRKFLNDCMLKGTVAGPMAVGRAEATERVMPRDAFAARAADRVRVRLARNETESFQIVVANLGADLRDVRVEVEGDLADADGRGFAAANVRACVLGYGEVTERPTYRIHPGHAPQLGWYPDPILDFLKSADVKGDDVQSFWVRVTCPEGQEAGTYEGRLLISSTSVAGPLRYEVPLAVRVNDFSLPGVSPLPLLTVFSPQVSLNDKDWKTRVQAKADSPIRVWSKHYDEWVDFLADRYITMDNIYIRSPKAVETRYLPAWRRLKAQGRLGWHCIGYFDPMPSGGEGEAKWRQKTSANLHAIHDRLAAEGLLEGAYFLGADELPLGRIEDFRRAAALVKEWFPDIPLATTGCSRGCGTKGSPSERLGAVVDMFIPTTESWMGQLDCVAKARAEGRNPGWYICNNPDYPYAQMFTESEPIEARMLMGAQTAKFEPAAFLVWQISVWNSPDVIGSGPYTDWMERTWGTDNGDGGWVYAGPDGTPLATVRLENFRDGLDDLWYAKLYERKFGRKPAIPETLVKDLKTFSRDPEELAVWRNKLADALER